MAEQTIPYYLLPKCWVGKVVLSGASTYYNTHLKTLCNMILLYHLLYQVKISQIFDLKSVSVEIAYKQYNLFY